MATEECTALAEQKQNLQGVLAALQDQAKGLNAAIAANARAQSANTDPVVAAGLQEEEERLKAALKNNGQEQAATETAIAATDEQMKQLGC